MIRPAGFSSEVEQRPLTAATHVLGGSQGWVRAPGRRSLAERQLEFSELLADPVRRGQDEIGSLARSRSHPGAGI